MSRIKILAKYQWKRRRLASFGAIYKAAAPPSKTPNATTHGTDVGARTLGKAVTADLTVDARGNILSLTVTDVRDRPVVGISV